MTEVRRILNLIGATPMCAECIAQRVGIEPAEIREAIDRVDSVILVVEAVRRCEDCQRYRDTFSLRPYRGGPA